MKSRSNSVPHQATGELELQKACSKGHSDGEMHDTSMIEAKRELGPEQLDLYEVARSSKGRPLDLCRHRLCSLYLVVSCRSSSSTMLVCATASRAAFVVGVLFVSVASLHFYDPFDSLQRPFFGINHRVSILEPALGHVPTCPSTFNGATVSSSAAHESMLRSGLVCEPLSALDKRYGELAKSNERIVLAANLFNVLSSSLLTSHCSGTGRMRPSSPPGSIRYLDSLASSGRTGSGSSSLRTAAKTRRHTDSYYSLKHWIITT